MKPQILPRNVGGLCVALLAGIIGTSSGALAQDPDSVLIPSGEMRGVLAHNVCREVTNNLGEDLHVPTRSSGEWTGTSSFLTLGSSHPKIQVTTCAAENLFDAVVCSTADTGFVYGGGSDWCKGGVTGRIKIHRQSNIFPITLADAETWRDSIDWAKSYEGRTPPPRPASLLPVCYQDSSMRSPVVGRYAILRKDTVFIPGGSPYCIMHSYSEGTQNTSGGPESTGAVDAYYRIWRQ